MPCSQRERERAGEHRNLEKKRRASRRRGGVAAHKERRKEGRRGKGGGHQPWYRTGGMEEGRRVV